MSCPFVAMQTALDKQRSNEFPNNAADGRYPLRCPISGRGAPASTRPAVSSGGLDFPNSNEFEGSEPLPSFRPMDRHNLLGAIIEDECDIEIEAMDKDRPFEGYSLSERQSPTSASPRPRTSTSPSGRFLNRDGGESHVSGRSMSMAGSNAGLEVRMSQSRYLGLHTINLVIDSELRNV
jgi:hypothetical protein